MTHRIQITHHLQTCLSTSCLLGLLLAAPAAHASSYPGARAPHAGTVLNAHSAANAPAAHAAAQPGSPASPATTHIAAPLQANATPAPVEPTFELGDPDSSPALFAARVELDTVPPAAMNGTSQPAALGVPDNSPNLFETRRELDIAPTAANPERYAGLDEPDDSPGLFQTRRELEPVRDGNAINRIMTSLMKPLAGGGEQQPDGDPNGDPKASVPASYESPGIVVKKETLRQTQLQPGVTETDIKMASLVPSSGEVVADSGPLIQLPEAPAAAATPAQQATTLPPAAPAPKPEITARSADGSEPKQDLSPASKAVLKKIPSNLDPAPKKPSGPIAVDRARTVETSSEAISASSQDKMAKHEKMGVKIEIKAPTLDLTYELEKAYNAMTAGQTSTAIDIYRNVLENDPGNKHALFGLGTLYHRAGQIDRARQLYSKLLSIDPNHRDGLNNFLVLMADEAPEAALAQLEMLEKRDPKFSPIPAQMAIIYEKMGDMDKASEKMFRAVDLAPENLVYRYNLAIMLDKQKKYDEAGRLYHQIVEAYQRGETVPGNIQQIQQRLTFISSNKP